MRVSGHDELLSDRYWQQSPVVALPQKFIVESASEYLLDQLRRQAAARTMVHVDAAMPHIQRTGIVSFRCIHGSAVSMKSTSR